MLGLSEALSTLVEAKFKSAKATQSLIFSSTELAIIRTSAGIPFQLRYCPALAKKPEPQRDPSTPAVKKPDPFHNPPSALHIANIPSQDHPSHILVLNKFPIIANHFILATQTNKQQTHFLEQDDLEMTYACLRAWQAQGVNGDTHDQGRLFAFFNSGAYSGASQPHRHLQFLPVESMRAGGETGSWDLLIDLILRDGKPGEDEVESGLLQLPSIPFTHYALQLPDNASGTQLQNAYRRLYQTARRAVEEYIASNPAFSLHATEGGELPISYNLAMTTAGMAILPRRSDGYMLRRDDGSELGFVDFNGTTLGGTMMVKKEEEWDLLRTRPEKLDEILTAIGIPRSG